MSRLKLSPAQISAMECRDWSEEPITSAAWTGEHLELPADFATADKLMSEIIEAANGEDATADNARSNGDGEGARFASRASWSLTAITNGIAKHMKRIDPVAYAGG